MLAQPRLKAQPQFQGSLYVWISFLPHYFSESGMMRLNQVDAPAARTACRHQSRPGSGCWLCMAQSAPRRRLKFSLVKSLNLPSLTIFQTHSLSMFREASLLLCLHPPPAHSKNRNPSINIESLASRSGLHSWLQSQYHRAPQSHAPPA